MGGAPSTLSRKAPVRLLEADTADSSQIVRAAASEELVTSAYEGVHTLYDNFQRGLKISPQGPCLGWRDATAAAGGGGAAAGGSASAAAAAAAAGGGGGGGDAGAYRWLTYEEVWAQVKAVGASLCSWGLTPGAEGKNFVGIFSINKPQWTIVEQACNAYSLVAVPLYDTLGPDAVNYIVAQSELQVVACSAAAVGEIAKQLDSFPGVCKHLLQLDGEVDKDLEAQFSAKGVTLHAWADAVDFGEKNPADPVPPKAADLATICYTSGTTGDPKGVMLTHGNIVADSAGAALSGVDIFPNDVHISYLPLAHMFERIVQVICLANGAAIGFFRGDVLGLFDDIAVLCPTLFPSVPRLFNRLYDKVMAGLEEAKESSALKRMLIESAWQAKKENLYASGELTHAVYDKLVFKPIKARLGGRVRLMITGSAPISAPVMEFLMICFGVPVLEGYGQTECTAAATVTNGISLGHVGAPLVCNEVKLVSVPDMEYLVTDNPPRGEICFRGPNVTRGYYKMPEKTQEAIDSDGWLHSGDIGTFTEDGWLKVIDRKKNIFKLAQGEYIAPEKLENCFVKSPYVAQSFIYGDSLQAALVGIVVPDEERLMPWAKEQGIDGDFAAVCKTDEARELVFRSMQDVGKVAELRGFEMPRKIVLSPELFTIENDLLTPTSKSKRPQLQKRYQADIDAMYASIA